MPREPKSLVYCSINPTIYNGGVGGFVLSTLLCVLFEEDVTQISQFRKALCTGFNA